MAVILVVDDENHMRRVIRRFLEEKGHDVLEAVNGLEALSAVKGHTVDVAVVDLIMPGMDGLEFLQWMQRDFPGTQTVVISAVDEIIDLAEREPNVLRTFRKPFALSQLAAAIEQVLRERGSSDEERAHHHHVAEDGDRGGSRR